MRGRISMQILSLGAAAALLAGCETIGLRSSPTPQPRPASLRVTPPAPAAPSARSQDLSRYYLQVQNDLLTRDQLRTDGGGPDTPFTIDDLTRNFENIVFFDEYTRGGGVTTRGGSGRLSRWSDPVRIGTEFGTSVPQATRDKDRARIEGYAKRLARLTNHPIAATDRQRRIST